jgi:HK97 family phage major capsid protein/HK97 family phage prohead protease
MEDNLKVTKVEGGEEFTASAYLYVPDPETPSTWKLRIEESPGKVTVAQLGRAAAALGPGFRGQRVDLPPDERRKAAKKLISLYRDNGVDDKSIPPYLWSIAGMQRPKSVQIKTANDGSVIVAGYGVVWGGVDLDGDTFTQETDLWLDRITSTPPVLYDHGMDARIGKSVLGRVVKTEPDDVGLWVEAQLDAHAQYLQYIEAIRELADKDAVGWSSGSVGHLVERNGGIIKSWPIVEFSLTTTPAEPRTLGVQALRALAGDVPAIKSMLLETDDGAPVAGESDDAQDVEQGADSDKISKREGKMEELNYDELADKLADKIVDRMPIKTVGVVNPPAADDKPDHVKNFKAYLLSGNAVKLKESADSQGGYFVPTALVDELITALSADSLLRVAGARVFSMPSYTVKVPGFSYSAAAALTSEGVAASATEPTATNVTFTAFRYTKLTKVSIELMQDSNFDVWREILAVDYAQAFADAENSAFTTGTGSSQPQGIVNATVGVTTASKSAITADEIIGWIYSLDYKYRQNARIMMSDSALLATRKLKDTTNQYLWQPGLAEGQPDRLLGIPVITNNKLDALGTAGGIAGVVFDPRFYWIGVRKDMSVQRLDERYADEGNVGFVAHMRFDGRIMLAAAFSALKLAAS